MHGPSTFHSHAAINGVKSIQSVLPTVALAERCMHADFCSRPTLNINVDVITLFDCIICIKLFGSGCVGSAQTPYGVHEREGKKEGLTEGERWRQA